MDEQRFDNLTRSLGHATSRRQALKVLAGGMAGGMVAWLSRKSVTRADNGNGNDDCAHFCTATFPPGPARGKCISDAAHGQGPCFLCGPSAPANHPPVCGAGTATAVCCASGQVCTANNTCCTPTTCAAQGKNCGSISDGCGGTLNCGTCTAPNTCGGGGTPYVCGCTDNGTACAGLNCGNVTNNCGQTVSCGTCTAPQTCGGGGTANVCGGGSGTCAHSECTTGAPLTSGCSACVTTVCAADSFCCTVSWDSICVGEAKSLCGASCGSICAHSECTTGAPLTSGCSACVTQICAQDAYCCNVSWDSICVGEAKSICGLSCAAAPSISYPERGVFPARP